MQMSFGKMSRMYGTSCYVIEFISCVYLKFLQYYGNVPPT